MIEKIVKTATLKEVIVNKVSEDHYKIMILTNQIKNFKKEMLIECHFSENNKSVINIYNGENETSSRKYIFEVKSAFIDFEKLSELTNYLDNSFEKNRRLTTMM